MSTFSIMFRKIESKLDFKGLSGEIKEILSLLA